MPADEFVRVIREDSTQPGLLYLGTETAVFVSIDDGAVWHRLRLNLPVVAIHDLLIKDADLIIGTHGRGMWILDDVTPIRELSAGVLDGGVHLCRPQPVHRLTRHVYGLDSLIALYHGFAADNPPSGAVIYYRLDKPARHVTISLLDETGSVVNSYDSRSEPRRPAPIGPMAYSLQFGSATLTGKVAGEEEPGIRWGAQTLDRGANPRQLPTGEGLHRVTLDITYPGARRVPGAQSRGITAPIAPPGMYTVRLTVDGEVREQPLEIRPDPRLTTTAEDYAAQFAFMIRLRDKVSEIHDTVNTLRDLRGQIEGRLRPLDDRAEWSPVREAAERVLTQLTAIEEVLIQPGLHERSGELDSVHFPIRLNNKLEALGYQVARSDDAPTAQAEDLYADSGKPGGHATGPLPASCGRGGRGLQPGNGRCRGAGGRRPTHAFSGAGRCMTLIHKVSSDWDARIWFEGTGWAERRLEVTPAIAGWDFLSFRTYTFRAGQVIDGESAGRRDGDGACSLGRSPWTSPVQTGPIPGRCRGRDDVFAGPPFALYLPPGSHLQTDRPRRCGLCLRPRPGDRRPPATSDPPRGRDHRG